MKLKYHIASIVSQIECGAFMLKSTKDNPPFCKAYLNYFPIGTIISPEADLKSIPRMMAEQYNSLIPDNQMKPKQIHPKENVYNWANADVIVNCATMNNR